MNYSVKKETEELNNNTYSVKISTDLTIDYYDPKTKTYLLSNRTSTTQIFKKLDYLELLDNKYADLGKLFILFQNVDSEGTIKQKKKQSDLAKMLKLDINSGQTRDFFKMLQEKDIIRKDPITKKYFMNPLLARDTYRIHINCYRVFRDILVFHFTNIQIRNLDEILKNA